MTKWIKEPENCNYVSLLSDVSRSMATIFPLKVRSLSSGTVLLASFGPPADPCVSSSGVKNMARNVLAWL